MLWPVGTHRHRGGVERNCDGGRLRCTKLKIARYTAGVPACLSGVKEERQVQTLMRLITMGICYQSERR